MITLYHLNHGCKDCVSGSVFDLLPINIAAGSEHTEAYEGWKQAFPAMAADKGQLSTLSGRLTADWQSRLDTLNKEALEALSAEHQSLAGSKITEQCRLLEEDSVLRDERARQLANLHQQMEAIPIASRVPETVAHLHAAQAARRRPTLTRLGTMLKAWSIPCRVAPRTTKRP